MKPFLLVMAFVSLFVGLKAQDWVWTTDWEPVFKDCPVSCYSRDFRIKKYGFENIHFDFVQSKGNETGKYYEFYVMGSVFSWNNNNMSGNYRAVSCLSSKFIPKNKHGRVNIADNLLSAINAVMNFAVNEYISANSSQVSSNVTNNKISSISSTPLVDKGRNSRSRYKPSDLIDPIYWNTYPEITMVDNFVKLDIEASKTNNAELRYMLADYHFRNKVPNQDYTPKYMFSFAENQAILNKQPRLLYFITKYRAENNIDDKRSIDWSFEHLFSQAKKDLIVLSWIRDWEEKHNNLPNQDANTINKMIIKGIALKDSIPKNHYDNLDSLYPLYKPIEEWNKKLVIKNKAVFEKYVDDGLKNKDAYLILKLVNHQLNNKLESKYKPDSLLLTCYDIAYYNLDPVALFRTAELITKHKSSIKGISESVIMMVAFKHAIFRRDTTVLEMIYNSSDANLPNISHEAVGFQLDECKKRNMTVVRFPGKGI